jgi:hypothetical protein
MEGVDLCSSEVQGMLVDGVNIMLQVSTRFLARASANIKM